MKSLVCFFFVLSTAFGFGQSTSPIENQFVSFHYNANWSAGDLGQRYGYMNNIGVSLNLKSKSGLTLGVESSFMFGNSFKSEFDSVFTHLIDSYGNITDINGDIARVLVYSRGFYSNAVVGQLYRLHEKSNNYLWVQFGLGYLQHRFRIETNSQVVPQIEQEYRKGYDRFTSGMNVSQFIGCALIPEDRYYNFFLGFYIQEGFTYNRRDINFDQPDTPVSNELRLDIQFGLRGGWLIPFYKAKPKDFYFE